jgi:sulfide:quinone oxidoreductase
MRPAPLDGDGFKVLIAGGGVAGVEGMLALRHMLGARAQIELVSSSPEFIYSPLGVAEPFGLGRAHRLPLAEIARDRRANFRRASLAGVDPQAGVATTDGGEEIPYDALLIAIGTRAVPEMPGALAYGGPAANEAYGDLLATVEEGVVRRIAYAVPARARWALPLYELALLTAQHASSHGIASLELTIVSPEGQPLEIFGPRASAAVKRLLEDAGIDFRGSCAPGAVEREGLLTADGQLLRVDRVVSLPRLVVDPLAGLPQGPDGFIGTDLHMRVDGLSRVFAAGDATWFPIKQGGVAAQQADVAATSIVACLDRDRRPATFRPMLRGALLTGSAPRYLRAEPGDEDASSAAGERPLWWPPSKIAARYLAPYLAHRGELDEPIPLGDLPPLHGEQEQAAVADQEEALELALAMADADASWRDYGGALRWLNIAEQLNLTLPPSHARLRDRCERKLQLQRQPG